MPNKKSIFDYIWCNCQKKHSKTGDFLLRFHNLKSWVSFSTGQVITKIRFWWFENLTQVIIYIIKQNLMHYHTYFRFSGFLADPTPKYQQTGVFISLRSAYFQSLCNIVVLYIKLFRLKRRSHWYPFWQYKLLGSLGIRHNVVFLNCSRYWQNDHPILCELFFHMDFVFILLSNTTVGIKNSEVDNFKVVSTFYTAPKGVYQP